jgi:diguanylate cyclase (GGDEF)-like protein
MKKFLKWLGVQDAFEKGLIARILVILCILYIIFGVGFVSARLVMTVLPGFPKANWTDLLIESSFFFVGIITLFLIRSDHLQAASRVVLTGMLFGVTLQAYFIGDPANDVAGAMGLLLFAILAILLLDRRDRWIAIFAVIGIFIALNVLSASGRLLPVVNLTPMGKTLFAFFIWLTVGIIIALVLIATMGAMRREPQLIQQRLDGLAQSESNGTTQNDLSFLSTHDDLTGLYNRLFFETEFTRLEKSRLYPISIIMADIDGLKKVNDKFGNRTGDEQLINVARLLTKVFRQEDIVSRYGDDEFAILLPGSDTAVVDVVMNRINKQINAYNKDHSSLPISISIGVSTAKQGESLKNHLRLAKKNMQQEKLQKVNH